MKQQQAANARAKRKAKRDAVKREAKTTPVSATRSFDIPELHVLSPQHKAFVVAYCSNGGNAKAACKAAGYSDSSAARSGVDILRRPDVQAAVSALRAQDYKLMFATRDRVLREYEVKGFGDFTELFKEVEIKVGKKKIKSRGCSKTCPS